MKNQTLFPKVFVIEDRQDKINMFIKALAGRADVISASTRDFALKVFEREEGITLIACDACLEKEEPDTIDIVRLIRSKFSGPIVAISSAKVYNEELMKAGCSHQALKDDAPELILGLIGQDLQYPLAEIFDGLPAKQAFLEYVLEFLHGSLTPSGIDEAMKFLDKLALVAIVLERQDLLPQLDGIKTQAADLKKYSDCFDAGYIKLLSEIRDALFQMQESV